MDAFPDVKVDKNSKIILSKPTLWHCHNKGGNQHWYLTQTGELRRDHVCLDFPGDVNGTLQMYPCHGQMGNQFWTYDIEVFCMHRKKLDNSLNKHNLMDTNILERIHNSRSEQAVSDG